MTTHFKQLRWLVAALLVLPAMCLGGCGGGGGGPAEEPIAASLVWDQGQWNDGLWK